MTTFIILAAVAVVMAGIYAALDIPPNDIIPPPPDHNVYLELDAGEPPKSTPWPSSNKNISD